MDTKVMELVTVATLERVIQECIDSGRYALDLETTGLNKNVYMNNRTQDSIVGVCLSPDGHKGYYLPLRHKKGEEHNLPLSKVEAELRRLFASPSVAVFHRAQFDQEFLEHTGSDDPLVCWDDPRKWDDTLILAYLRDTRDMNKGLKALAKRELGITMLELNELFLDKKQKKLDFSELDPSWGPVVWYATSDAICTYLLYQKLAHVILQGTPERENQSQVYTLEKLCLPATRWMERTGIYVSQEKVTELTRLGQHEYYQCLEDIYDFVNNGLGRNVEPGWFRLLRERKDLDNVDYSIRDQIENLRKEAAQKHLDPNDDNGKAPVVVDDQGVARPERYDVLSRQQLGVLFEELQIPDLRRTENSNQVQTTQSEIERLNESYGDQYPFLPKISRLGELQKALGTYLLSLIRDSKRDGCIHPYYNQLGTDTGRFTTPSSGNPDLDGGTKFPVHGTPATYDKKRPQCLLRIREAFAVRSPDHIMVAPDFSGVELRIATNYSREPLWIAEYFRCSTCDFQFDRGDGQSTPPAPPTFCPRCGSDKIGDLHSLTAITFYGKDKVGTKEFKLMRQKAKSANFALVYGGGPSALMRATGCDENEGARHHRSFNQTYRVLKDWWDEVKGFARKTGYVKTDFGRQYPLPDIKLPITPREEPDPVKRQMNKKFRAKAERNATNGPIQGLSADLTKLAMGLIYKETKKRGWMDKVFPIITIHDELVFEIHKSIAAEAITLFREIMTRNKAVLSLKHPIPLTTDCEVGYDWSVPYNINVFEYGLINEEGVELNFDGTPTDKKWPKDLFDAFWGKLGTTQPRSPSTEDNPAPVSAPVPASTPTVPPGSPYEFQVPGLSYGVMEKLATVIFRCQGRGTSPLVLVAPTGERLSFGSDTYLVNPMEFETLARDKDLL